MASKATHRSNGPRKRQDLFNCIRCAKAFIPEEDEWYCSADCHNAGEACAADDEDQTRRDSVKPTERPTPAPKSNSFSDRMLDHIEAAAFLSSIGLHMSPSAVRQAAYKKKFPFFKAPNGKLVIYESALRNQFLKMQSEAARETESAESHARRAAGRRR